MDGYDATKYAHHHESFFRDKTIVLLIKVFKRVAESFNDSTLPVDFTCEPYFVTKA